MAAGSIRSRVAGYAADPSAIARDAIDAALARGDDDDAVARVVARLSAGVATTIDEVIEALPGAPGAGVLFGIVGKVTGDRAGALLALVERGRFPSVWDLRVNEVAALLAVWRLGDRAVTRDRIARQMRRIVRGELEEVAASVATALIRELDDAHVAAEAKLFKLTGEPAVAERAYALMTGSISELVAALPDADRGAPSGGFTVRAADRPGRNEPCHCGSGKKYKKCHAEEDDAAAAAGSASPIAGMSWDDYLTRGAPQLLAEDIQKLPLVDLARLDLDGLRRAPLLTVFEEVCAFRRWDLALRVIAAVRRHAELGDEVADKLVGQLAGELLSLGDLGRAREVAAVARDATKIHPSTALELLLRGVDRTQIGAGIRHDALDHVEALARAAVTAGDVDARYDLAGALLGASPALGILVARGLLDAQRVGDSETLLDSVEEARDALGLAPGDPGWDLWDDLLAAAGVDPRAPGSRRRVDPAEAERHKLSREAAELRATLHVEADRAAKLESELAIQRAALAAIQPSAARGERAADADAVARARELRERVEMLEARIREGNEERVELRRKLETGGPKPARGAAADAGDTVGGNAPSPEDEDAAEGVEDVVTSTTGRRGVLIPRFDDAAARALSGVPTAVAAEALRTIGELAAGEGLAWHRVKQARDMRTPLFMARVGIHHRLLFRVDDRLAIIDVVAREGLLHALKRLRSG